MVALVGAFPSRDVQTMVEGRPSLLLMSAGDLKARCERVVGKLMQLHPSKDEDVIAGESALVFGVGSWPCGCGRVGVLCSRAHVMCWDTSDERQPPTKPLAAPRSLCPRSNATPPLRAPYH